MQLVKFCKPDHNIHSNTNSKLRIGTLYSYRKMEGSELHDAGEGKFSLEINFPEVIELDRRWANLLFSGLVYFSNGELNDTPRFPGTFNAEIKELNIRETKENSVVLENASVLVHRSVPNSFIFCMSVMDHLEKRPFEKYEDSWSVPFDKASALAERIGEMLYSQAPLNIYEPLLLSRNNARSIKNLSFQVQHQKVVYCDRVLNIANESQMTFEQLVERLRGIQFVKPKKYQEESEYRFIFTLNDQINGFPPIVEYFDLELNRLALV